MAEFVTYQALGRVSAIGNLYDARRESFCQENIFKSQLPPSAIQSTHNQQVDTSYSMSSKLTDKFNILGITGQMRVSILGKILEASGSGEYLSDEKTSRRTVHGSVIHSVKTTSDSLDIFEEELKPLISTDAALCRDATHIVVGIQWGANAILSVEHKNPDYKSEQDIEGKLKSMLEPLSLGLGTSQELKTAEDCSFRIFADHLPKNAGLSQSLEGFVDLMSEMPELLKDSNNGKGKPLSYTMIPISALQEHIGLETSLDNLVQDIEPQTITSIENLFDETSLVKQNLNDFEKQLNCSGQAALDRILEIKLKFGKNCANFLTGFSKALVQFRSGEKDHGVFQDLISEFHSDEYSIEKVEIILNEFSKLILKATGMARYIEINKGLVPKHYKYVFNHNMPAGKCSKGSWEANKQAFIALLNRHVGGNENGPICVSVENGNNGQSHLSSGALTIINFKDGGITSKDLIVNSEKRAHL